MPKTLKTAPKDIKKKDLITLGIETSCDETSVAILRGDREVLANTVVSSLKEHTRFGGVIPEIASRSHLETILPCLDLALSKARVSVSDIDLIAVTQGPGLMGSLLVGVSAAKALALATGKPLVGVDHIAAHAYAGFLCDPEIRFPVLGLVVSGGHTLLMKLDSPSRMQVLGETGDDAAGEAFDKVAKMLGLGYPGGPVIDRLAKDQDTKQFHFKRPYLSKDSLDFSFSGLKTAVLYTVNDLKKKRPLSMATKKALCAGFQETVCDVLVEKAVRACRQKKLETIVVGGGVSANSRLREKLTARGRAEGLRVVFPDFKLCLDNAIMIAGLGAALYKEGRTNDLEMGAYSDFSEFIKNASRN